jgi:hypothetical protein
MSDTDKNKAIEQQAPVPLDIMLGQGRFVAQGKEYVVKALKLKQIDELKKDTMATAVPFFDLVDKEMAKKLDKWFSRLVFRADNHKGAKDGEKEEKGLTVQDLCDDDWDLDDLRNLWKAILRISG